MGGRRLFTGIVRDITARKLSEAQLVESEARTRAILAAAVDAIIIIDASGNDRIDERRRRKSSSATQPRR